MRISRRNNALKFFVVPIRLFSILLFLTAPSCSSRDDHGISSMAKEQEFWSRWIKDNGNGTCQLEPFYSEQNNDLWKQIEDRIISMSNAADTFILVVRKNYENGLLDAVGVKNGKERVYWNLGHQKVSESLKPAATVPDEILEKLCSKDVFCDGSAIACDETTLYVFLKYRGKWSRYALYAPDIVFSKKNRDAITIPLKSLLHIVFTQGPQHDRTEDEPSKASGGKSGR